MSFPQVIMSFYYVHERIFTDRICLIDIASHIYYICITFRFDIVRYVSLSVRSIVNIRTNSYHKTH